MTRIWIAGILFCALLATLYTADEKKPRTTISHGPILGRPGPHSMGVWARTSKPGSFTVRYGTDPFHLNQTSKKVQTSFDHDCTGWTLLTNLKSDTLYYYQVVGEGNKTGFGGTFTTMPDAKDYRHPKLNPKGLFNVRFEFACGNNQTPGQGGGPTTPAFKTMLKHLQGRIQFAIQNGDWHYEDQRDYKVKQWQKQVGADIRDIPRAVQVAPTLVGIWENYKIYLKRSANLRAWHKHIPSYFTFDDHEMLNDIWGAGTAGLRDRRAVVRDIGTRAWYDYLGWSNPISYKEKVHFGEANLKKGSDILTDPGADFTKLDFNERSNLHVHWGTPTAAVNDNALDGVGGDPNAGVYDVVKVLGKDKLQISPAAKKDGVASYSIGRLSYFKFRVANCEFFILDTRSQREMHDVKNPNKDVSMLGKKQKAWLKASMKKSDADFFFVVSSVNFMVPHVGGGKVRATNKDDAWTVFLRERSELIKFWDGLDKRVFVLTGDLHNSFVIKITDRVWEFASGPHNSNNHLVKDEGERPANGEFEYAGHKCDIRWSSYFINDIPRTALRHPHYCVVQVNNVFNTPKKLGEKRWMAFPKPHVIFQYYDGLTGELKYAETLRK